MSQTTTPRAAIDEYMPPQPQPAFKVENAAPAPTTTLEAVLAETRSVTEAAQRLLANRPTAWQPRTWAELEAFARRAARSGMVPKAYSDREDDIILAIQMGAELGLAPMQALQNIACINGRPSVWGDAIPGLCYASGKCVYIREWFEGEGDELTAFCATLRRGEPAEGVQSFSVADAVRAGLWQTQAKITRHRRDGSGSWEAENDSPWWKYPRRMLQNRARMILRDKYPDVLKGLISAEEAMDLPPAHAPEPPRHVGGAPLAQPPKPPPGGPKPPGPPPPMPTPQPTAPPPMATPEAPPVETPEPPQQPPGPRIEARIANAVDVIATVDTPERLANIRKKVDALLAEAPDWAVDQINNALAMAEQRIAAAAADPKLQQPGAFDWSNRSPPEGT